MASEGVLGTLRAGWAALASVEVPKALIGGLALTAWNHARYTRDADVLVAISANDVDRLHQEVKAHGLEQVYRSIWIDAYPGEPLPGGF